MADVGARAGVTARTVSNVLSNSPLVRPETRDRVLRAVDELGYRMNTAARSLKTGRTGAITLAIPDLGIEYFSHLARLIIHEAEQFGWAVVIEQTGARRSQELKILSGAQRQHSDGLIFQPHELGAGDERYLTGNDRLVMLGERIFSSPVDHVTMAHTEAARVATQYLIGTGHRRIAVIGANPSVRSVNTASLRVEGYQQALAAAGISVPEEYIAVCEQWHLQDGRRVADSLLSLPEPPTAIFCLNDTLAFATLNAAHRRGLHVPDDLAVVGFDNVPFAEFSVPPLTTIEPGTAEIARTAIGMLAKQVEGRAGTPSEVFADYSLVVRRSA